MAVSLQWPPTAQTALAKTAEALGLVPDDEVSIVSFSWLTRTTGMAIKGIDVEITRGTLKDDSAFAAWCAHVRGLLEDKHGKAR